MKSEKQIRERLRNIQQSKATAKYKGRDESYIINSKLEKLFKWVLDEEPIGKKRKYRGLKK